MVRQEKEDKSNGEPETSVKDERSPQSKKQYFVVVIAVIVTLIAIYVHKYRTVIEVSESHQNATDTLFEVQDDFLDVVTELLIENYKDEDLVEWQPPPPLPKRKKEPGDMGSAVVVPPELKAEAERRFKENEFNVVANELMSVNRTLRDGRYPKCLSIEYPKKLPSVSVIVVFHNEAWSSLIRTIWSVINTTPKALLEDIILVDDFSDRKHLGKQLDDYIAKLPVKVVLKRQPSRKGLMQARLEGVKLSSAKVIVFLDAHCECNQGWLIPLLAPIVQRRTNVVVPIIDVINFRDMRLLTAVTSTRGIFDVTMDFAWGPVPDHEMHSDSTKLTRAPAMAGGLFAMDREYFYALGAYDGNMVCWGGENIEMSLRIWMCGGSILSAPCARVGHIFRDHSPYKMPGGNNKVIYGNKARFVDVWLDEYKKVFYNIVHSARRLRTDVSDRLALRKQLKCKSFKWYLKNIFPESLFNMDFITMSPIRSLFLEHQCLDTMGNEGEATPVKMSHCHDYGGNQAFVFTGDDEIRTKHKCLDATAIGEPVTMYRCHGQKGNQYWVYNPETNELKHGKNGACLSVNRSRIVSIAECNGSISQQWVVRLQGPEKDGVDETAESPIQEPEEDDDDIELDDDDDEISEE